MAKTILIIDDDPDAILFLSTVLKDHGYRTIDAHDGEEGLMKAKSELPDLILLDLMMPQKSGIALLSDLKEAPSLKEIPVIMVTGVAGETGIKLDAFFERSPNGEGGDDSLRTEGYIEKPVDPQKLLALVRRVLG